MKLENLSLEELQTINGGTDNCPAEPNRSIVYYIGYGLGWFFD